MIKKNDETHWDVFVTKPAHDGEANKAVIQLLAEELGVAKSRISIKSGDKSKYKTVEILEP
jgi:uncharacterized protein YggU (UPF0235/DUF167 family)